MQDKRKVTTWLVSALKIAVGSSAAIFIARAMELDHYTSAGIITLLTLMTTKWETLRLSVLRLITYAISMILGVIIFTFVKIDWLAYGLFIFSIIFITFALGWRATISVNAVLGTHLLIDQSIGADDLINELLLVVIGIVIALILNLFHDYKNQKKTIVESMRCVEGEMRKLMNALAEFLSGRETDVDIIGDFEKLKAKIQDCLQVAHDYQDNTFHSHPAYYIAYFEMRLSQCNVIYNLYMEIKKIKILPARGTEVSEFMKYLADNIVELNDSEPQLKKIEEMFEEMRQGTPPDTMEEFENYALLYHVLSDLEEFLYYNLDFIKGLDERQIKEYRS